MELINLKSLSLTMEESKDIIKFIAQKRGISTKKLLSTIKPNLKRKNNKILTTKTQQKLRKTLQKLTKTQKNLIKIQKNLIKTQKNQIKTKTQQKSLKLEKRKNTQNLAYEKHENLTSQKQQILSNTKKRIEIIRKKT